jgi:ABC-type multidrug transport system ATPase subunit
MFLNKRIEHLSKGFKRRVGIAQAIIHDPEILIMDEPTDGLDPNQKYDVRELIKKISKDKTIIISTHILEEVEAVCTRAAIIAKGKLLFDDTPSKFKNSGEGSLDDTFRKITLEKGIKMKNISIIFNRELSSYFSTPIAYVFLVIFLFAVRLIYFLHG